MQNLIVRPARVEDAEQMVECGVELSMEWPAIDIPMAPGEFTYTVEQEREIIQTYARSDNSIFLVAELDGRLIGLLNIRGSQRLATRHTGTLGISVRKGWRGQGVGDRLMAAAVAWARANPVLTRVELQVYARNQAGVHLYEKYGFVLEGRRRRAIFQAGEYLDDLLMALVMEEKEKRDA